MTTRRKNELFVQPLVKWVGGKRQLIKEIELNAPADYKRLIEPFFGGGAVAFHFQKTPLIINDLNEELIAFYETVRDNPDELIEKLAEHKTRLLSDDGGADYFYEVRGWDRDADKWETLTKVDISARLLFLNKTCYNGLFRVNNAGEFNAPYGGYKNPDINPEGKIRAVSKFLNRSGVKIMNGDYKDALRTVKAGDFVYLDPPYDPVSDTASFTGYTKSGFGREDQQALFEQCVRIHDKGGLFLLSNSSTDFIRKLYDREDFHIVPVKANRAINADSTKRGAVEEVLIRNYNKNT